MGQRKDSSEQLDALQAELGRAVQERDALQSQVIVLRDRLAQAERQWSLVGNEVHDGLLQDLTAAVMFFESARQDSATAERKSESFQRGLQLVREAIDEARRLVERVSLFSATEADETLLPAIERLVERVRRDHGLEVEFVQPVVEPKLSPAACWSVVRIVREALANVWRHSRTKRVEVAVRQQDRQLVVTVRDWGVGFDPLEQKPGHFGLTSIQRRAALLGGVATISSSPGQGTTVLVSLPLAE
jgi:signal transduction histidine kinase